MGRLYGGDISSSGSGRLYSGGGPGLGDYISAIEKDQERRRKAQEEARKKIERYAESFMVNPETGRPDIDVPTQTRILNSLRERAKRDGSAKPNLKLVNAMTDARKQQAMDIEREQAIQKYVQDSRNVSSKLWESIRGIPRAAADTYSKAQQSFIGLLPGDLTDAEKIDTMYQKGDISEQTYNDLIHDSLAKAGVQADDSALRTYLKAGGRFAEIALDIATLGTTKIGTGTLKGVFKSLAPDIAQKPLSTLSKITKAGPKVPLPKTSMGEGALYGALGGGFGAAGEDDASIASVAIGAGIGGTLGGALGSFGDYGEPVRKYVGGDNTLRNKRLAVSGADNIDSIQKAMDSGEVAPAVVQIVDSRGRQQYFTVPRDEFVAIRKRIDDTNAVGKFDDSVQTSTNFDEGGTVHLSNTTPSKLENAGFEYGGQVTSDTLDQVIKGGAGYRVTTPDESIVGDPQKWAKATAKERKKALKAAQKSKYTARERIATNIMDSNYTMRKRIYDALNASGKTKKETQNFMDRLELATGNTARSSEIADAFNKQNGLYDVMQQLDNETDYNNFIEYLLAKQRTFRRAEALEKGTELASDYAKKAPQDAKTIQAFDEIYSPLASKLHEYSQAYLREMADPESILFPGGRVKGIIDPEIAEKMIRDNPEYIPLEKILDEVEQSGTFVGGGPGSISKQNVVRTFEGKGGIERDPLEAIFDKSMVGFNQVAKNETAQLLQELADIPGNPLGIKVLRSADNVRERLKLRTALKESKPIKTRLTRELKKSKREMNNLRRGIKEYQEQLQRKKANVVKKDLRKTLATEPDSYSAIKNIDTETVDSLYEGLLELKSTPHYEGMRNILSKRNRAYQEAFQRVDDITRQLDELNTVRKQQYLEQLKRSDESFKDKHTISRLDNGVKETYEVPEYIEMAMKQANPKQANAIIRTAFMINRIRKLGFTGSSPGFAVRNVPRDLAYTSQVSRRGIKTLNPVSVVKGYFDIILDTAARQDAERFGALGNLVDTYRPTRKNVQKIANSGSLKSKIKHKVTTPSELFKTIEDMVSVTETASRQKNYDVTYRNVLKETGSKRQAKLQATLAARRDSVDFFTQGRYGDLIKAWGLYLNPGIQGGRRLGQSFKDQPVRTTARMAAITVGPAIATTVWNMADENRRKIYDDIEDWEKESNFIIIPPWAQKVEDVIKIPKAPGISEIGNSAQRIAESWIENGHTPDAIEFLKEGGFALFNTFNPESSGIAGAVTPDPVQPIVEQAVNRDFFKDKPIIEEYMKDYETQDQTNKGVSGTATLLSSLTGVAPVRTQKFIKDMTGSAGDAAINLLDALLIKTDVIEREGGAGGRSVVDQIVGSFKGSYGGKIEREFREELDDVADDYKNTSKLVNEFVDKDDREGASRVAMDYNRRVMSLLEALSEKDIDLSDAQRKFLEDLGFPEENGGLSSGSWNYRRNR